MSGHEISRLQHGLQLIMARCTRTINLYVYDDDGLLLRTTRNSSLAIYQQDRPNNVQDLGKNMPVRQLSDD